MAGRYARYGRQRERVWGGRIKLALALVVVGALLFVAWAKLDTTPPEATLVRPLAHLGRDATIDVRLADAKTGLRTSRVELEAGGERFLLASADYPRANWRRSSVLATTLSVPLDPAGRRIPEGPAILRVYADDYSWLRWFRSAAPRLEQDLTIDVSPPTVEVLTQQHYLTLGGVELLLYRTSADAVRSGVEVGPYFFPGTAGLFVDGTIRAAFFAVPQDLDAKAVPKAVAEDAAGNQRTVGFHAVVKPRRFSERTLEIDDAFLARKVPDLLAANQLPPADDLVAGYLTVNRDLRKASEARIQEVSARSAPSPLWQGAFVRQPDSAPLSGFGDRRTYTHKGETIDQQTHLGFDLASLRQSPVVAANSGVVAFAGPLGIYGDTVIIDHGLGIFSLYGHLSAITTSAGQEVARGQAIGRTGETGLAGGDHLHFSIMLYGTHVDPVEWWDGKWIADHVTAKLELFPRVTMTARRSE